MRLVEIESPYGSDDPAVVKENVEYAKKCVLDSLHRGESPYASHLFFTQMLDDRIPKERRLGMEAGKAWTTRAEASVFYCDLGFSKGMVYGLDHAIAYGREIEFRFLDFEYMSLIACSQTWAAEMYVVRTRQCAPRSELNYFRDEITKR